MSRSALRTLAVTAAAALCAGTAHAQELRIHTINVGRGDCALIVSPTGTRVLVDTGKPGDGNATVIPYLQSVGVTDLDYILISHYDGDHIGGVPELLAAGYSPLAIYDRGNFDAEMHTIWQDYVAAAGALRTTITLGMLLDLGGGVTMRSYIQNGQIWGGPTINVVGKVENAKSAGWKLEYGHFDYGTFGDIGQLLENSFGSVIGDLDVYKASHHGSDTSSTSGFIGWIKPDVTFISSGSDSSNPKQGAISNINTAAGMRWVYMTNDSYLLTRGGRPAYANMLLTTDGTTYTIEGPTVPRQTFLCDELAGVQPGPGQIELAEYMPDPDEVDDLEGEWIEIENLTDQWFSMKGWTFEDLGGASVTIASNALLAPRQRLVVASQGDAGRNGGLFPGAVWPKDQFALENGPDEVLVDNAQGVRIVDFQNPGNTFKGRSWERVNMYVPNPVANMLLGTVEYGLGDRGTPGARNTADATPWIPRILATSPDVGPAAGGTWVTLEGYDLAVDGAPLVRFGRLPAVAIEVVDDDTVRAMSPSLLKAIGGPGALAWLLSHGALQLSSGPGLGLDVTITAETPGGLAHLPQAFTFSFPMQAPASLPK